MSGSRGTTYQNLRVVNLECDYLRIDTLLRINGHALGTADLVNTASFITLSNLVQVDYDATDSTSLAYIKNKPVLKTVAFSGDYNDLINKPAVPAGSVSLGTASFGSLTCTGPLRVGPSAGVGTAAIPQGVQLYTSEGYDDAGSSHSLGDARVNFSAADNFVGYCKVYVKNLQASSSAAKTGFISFVWMKASGTGASNCSTVIMTRNSNMSVLKVALVGSYPTVYTDSDCLTSWSIEIGG